MSRPDFRPDGFGRRGGTATKVLGRALRKLKIIDRARWRTTPGAIGSRISPAARGSRRPFTTRLPGALRRRGGRLRFGLSAAHPRRGDRETTGAAVTECDRRAAGPRSACLSGGFSNRLTPPHNNPASRLRSSPCLAASDTMASQALCACDRNMSAFRWCWEASPEARPSGSG
jgi:hypothetical protein